jgi:hypothetical protein
MIHNNEVYHIGYIQKFRGLQGEVELQFTAGADIYQPSYSVRQFGHGGKNSDWRSSVLWFRRRLGHLPEREESCENPLVFSSGHDQKMAIMPRKL